MTKKMNRYQKKVKQMKKIQVMQWIEPEPDPEHPGKLIDVKYETPKILSLLIAMLPPADMPRGREQFKLMSKINTAFEQVEEKIDTDEKDIYLFLEENEYNFLKGLYEKYIPVAWGRSKNISKCFEYFDQAEDYDPNTKLE